MYVCIYIYIIYVYIYIHIYIYIITVYTRKYRQNKPNNQQPPFKPLRGQQVQDHLVPQPHHQDLHGVNHFTIGNTDYGENMGETSFHEVDHQTWYRFKIGDTQNLWFVLPIQTKRAPPIPKSAIPRQFSLKSLMATIRVLLLMQKMMNTVEWN